MDLFGMFKKKKEDDFSFSDSGFSSKDNSSFNGGSDSFSSSSNGSSDPFSSQSPADAGLPPLDDAHMQKTSSFDTRSDPLANASYLGPDTVSSEDDPFRSGSEHSSQPLPAFSQQPQQPEQHSMASPGQRMAHDYIRQERQEGQPVQQNSASASSSAGSSDHAVEMMNVKLDAIRSSLDALNQRLQHIEQIIQSNNNRRW